MAQEIQHRQQRQTEHGEIVTFDTIEQLNARALKLVGVSRRVLDLLKLTKVLPLFECLGDEPSAIASFSDKS